MATTPGAGRRVGIGIITATLIALAATGVAPTGAVARPAQPTVPLPQPVSAAFPPGIWKGAAVVTGGISGQGTAAFVVAPITVRFELEVAPDGTVVSGVWDWAGEISSAAEGVEGSFSMSASGPLSGTGARVTMSGIVHMSGSVTVQGAEYPIENDAPAEGAFSPEHASCNVVTGDMATEGQEAQAAAGMATTVTGPFTAQRIGDPGDDVAPGFEETFAELVTTAEGLLAAGQPPAADVVALAERAEDFYTQVFLTAQCPSGAENLLPGQQPYTFFVELISQLLVVALADPSGYSVYDVQLLASAAVRIGAVGDAAPDAALAQQVRNALLDAATAKLADAVATENELECTVVVIISQSMGFPELLAGAQACAGG